MKCQKRYRKSYWHGKFPPLNSHFLWEGVIRMLLQDNKERQVVLGQNPHTKEFTVAVYNKETGKKRVYKTKKMMHKLICECI